MTWLSVVIGVASGADRAATTRSLLAEETMLALENIGVDTFHPQQAARGVHPAARPGAMPQQPLPEAGHAARSSLRLATAYSSLSMIGGMAYIMNLSTLPVIGRTIEFTLHGWLLAGGFAAAMAMCSWPP